MNIDTNKHLLENMFGSTYNPLRCLCKMKGIYFFHGQAFCFTFRLILGRWSPRARCRAFGSECARLRRAHGDLSTPVHRRGRAGSLRR